jgi:hypothetical protein
MTVREPPTIKEIDRGENRVLVDVLSCPARIGKGSGGGFADILVGSGGGGGWAEIASDIRRGVPPDMGNSPFTFSARTQGPLGEFATGVYDKIMPRWARSNSSTLEIGPFFCPIIS